MSKYDFDLNLDVINSLSLILERINPGSTVLEFGPANGRMTKYLKEEMNCKVYTVELDEEAANEAANYSEKIIVGNIEAYEWLKIYAKIEFDYIVFADVLEHLYYPEKVLDAIRILLKENGSILFSIPNIAHNAIIMELLQDKFTYNPVGLLDDTHIRFFTKYSLDAMIARLGYHTVYQSGVYVSPVHTEFYHNYSELDESIAKYLQKRVFGEVYQFVYELKKRPGKLENKLERYQEFKLYYDTGDGFSEANTQIVKLQNHQVVFDLSKVKGQIKQLRIDPTENAVKLRIKNLQIDGNDFKDTVTHNGIENEREGIIFLHQDPQLFLFFKKAKYISRVQMVLESFSMIENIDHEIVKHKEEQIENLYKQYNEIKKKLEKHNEILLQKDQQLQQKDEQIAQLHEIAQSMRIKNRIKSGIKKILGK